MNLLLFLQSWPDDYLQAQIEAGGPSAQVAHILPLIFWLVIGVAALAVIMSLFSMIKNPGSLKNFLIGLVSIAVLAGIAFALKGNDTIPDRLVQLGSDQGTYNIVGAGILMTMLLIGIGLLAILWGVVKGIFK